ncbi:MAG TPA: CHAT domain-containing protein [Thermoanaerobaculia bacterium]|nr:CHAT domain-containing protein [Thermoanaerobaculia bacterium]
MSDRVPRHPEAQTMAAFVDGTLPPGEIAAVAEHLRSCSDCRTAVSETARFTDEEEPHGHAAWWTYAAAVLAVAIVATSVVLQISHSRSPINRLIAAAPQEHRLVEARPSGFPWARLQAPSRGEARPDSEDLRFGGVAGDVLESNDLHAKGVAYLVTGHRSDSITALERAANDSSDPKVWNDLAAARYTAAVEDDHPSQLPDALADADHALRLDPGFAEALFNRALILEHLGILEAARKAWATYLAVDPDSGWSTEARNHLHKLSGTSRRFDKKMIYTAPVEQLVREFPEEARRYGEAVVLPDHIDRAGAIGDALAAHNGEQLLRDAVRALEGATRTGHQTLADAYREYRDGRLPYSTHGPGVAETHLRRAAELFRQGGSPMAYVSRYYAASAAFDQHRPDVDEELRLLLSAIDQQRYRSLSASIGWALANSAIANADWGTAAREADGAATTFVALGEVRSAAFVEGLSAMAYEMMGERDLAWSHRTAAYAELSKIGAVTQLHTMLHGATVTLSPLDQDEAAMALSNLITEEKDPLLMAEVNAERTRWATRAGNAEAASASVEDARLNLPRISDPALRETATAQVDLADATAKTISEPQKAIAELGGSITLFAHGGLSRFLPEAYLQRGRAYRQSGNATAALADCASAMEQIEKQDATIRDPWVRMAFFDTAAQVVGETIDLHLARGGVAEAFSIADRWRALTGPLAPRATASSVRAKDVALIEYVVRPRAVMIFCVVGGIVSAVNVRVERHELSADVEAFSEDVRTRAPIEDAHRSGAALYQLLIAPVHPRLTGMTEIVLVPDQQLYRVPFAALWDDREKQYLVEQHVIRFAPSACGEAPALDAGLSPALVIADPLTSNSPRLRASRDEAANIAHLYGAVLLEGEKATRAGFEKLAPQSALIHFAGHANSDAAESYGALRFASANGDSGIVSSGQIARLSLPRHPLIVLAACGTLRGAMHVAGMSSLARSFLLAGARDVVGTLWEIEDDVSSPLFTRFHQLLRAGASPARSLRDAQLEALRSADPLVSHPATWSPVELLGNV